MHRSPGIVFWSQVLASMTILVLAGCGSIAKIKRPIPSPIATEPFIHYTSPKRFNVHLEFDYPSSWIYDEERDADIVAISLKDPRFLALPTPFPPDFHPAPNDIGSVVIWVTASKPGQSPETEAEMLKQ